MSSTCYAHTSKDGREYRCEREQGHSRTHFATAGPGQHFEWSDKVTLTNIERDQ